MAGLMTQSEFARHRGVGKSAVSNWKKDGHLVLAEGTDGRLYVDAARTDARLNARLDPMRGRPTAAAAAPAAALPFDEVAAAAPIGAGDSLQTVRMELIRRQSTGHALKNAQTAGELAAVGELEQRASAIGRAARERVQAFLRGEAERLAAERDIRVIMSLLEEGIDRVFADLADAAEAGEFAETEEPELEAQAEAELEAAIVADEEQAA
jgi:hypothetical protein